MEEFINIDFTGRENHSPLVVAARQRDILASCAYLTHSTHTVTNTLEPFYHHPQSIFLVSGYQNSGLVTAL